MPSARRSNDERMNDGTADNLLVSLKHKKKKSKTSRRTTPDIGLTLAVTVPGIFEKTGTRGLRCNALGDRCIRGPNLGFVAIDRGPVHLGAESSALARGPVH